MLATPLTEAIIDGLPELAEQEVQLRTEEVETTLLTDDAVEAEERAEESAEESAEPAEEPAAEIADEVAEALTELDEAI